jgi:hypothetical protein
MLLVGFVESNLFSWSDDESIRHLKNPKQYTHTYTRILSPHPNTQSRSRCASVSARENQMQFSASGYIMHPGARRSAHTKRNPACKTQEAKTHKHTHKADEARAHGCIMKCVRHAPFV